MRTARAWMSELFTAMGYADNKMPWLPDDMALLEVYFGKVKDDALTEAARVCHARAGDNDRLGRPASAFESDACANAILALKAPAKAT